LWVHLHQNFEAASWTSEGLLWVATHSAYASFFRDRAAAAIALRSTVFAFARLGASPDSSDSVIGR